MSRTSSKSRATSAAQAQGYSEVILKLVELEAKGRALMPKVVNLKGRKPQVVHDGEVYIGHRLTRGGWDLPESKWANPFKIGRDGTREQVIALYEYFVRSKPELIAALPELRGEDLRRGAPASGGGGRTPISS